MDVGLSGHNLNTEERRTSREFDPDHCFEALEVHAPSTFFIKICVVVSAQPSEADMMGPRGDVPAGIEPQFKGTMRQRDVENALNAAALKVNFSVYQIIIQGTHPARRFQGR